MNLLAAFFVFLMCVCHKGHAIRIEIKNGVVKAEPLAVTNFKTENDHEMARKIPKIIADDLVSSGLFRFINQDSYIQSPESLDKDGPNMPEWRVLGARFLVMGTVSNDSSKLKTSFKLYDIVSGKLIGGISLGGERSHYRRIAHMISDYIFHRITGEDGFFNTHIAFVETAGTRGKNTRSRIMRMDFDGANVTTLTDSKDLSLGPRYAPDGKSIVYYRVPQHKAAEIYMMDLASNRSSFLGKFEGLRIAPRFSPDSSNIIFSLAKNGTSALYRQYLTSRKVEQLTEHSAIDTSPCYDPTGEKIVFTSDRGGRPQLYVMNADGTEQKRISYGEGSYFQPMWSPRGDYIAFTKTSQRQFFIGVIKPDGTGERLIASGYMLESPVWTANGRYLLFTRQQSVRDKTRIVLIDLTGHNMHIIETPKDASDPALSALLGSAILKH